ncbi:MAG: NUMOD3 domain-containing DNA-binding protein, partial [Candidatus Aenigmatarchaeota archaeon]
ACDLGLKKTKSFISELRKTIGAKQSFKSKISRAQKGKRGYWTGRRRSAGTKRKISKTMRAMFKTFKPRSGAAKRHVRKAARKAGARAKPGFWSFLSRR